MSSPLISENQRYFIVSAAAPTDLDPHAELIQSLTRINTFNPPVQTCSTGWKFDGLFKGPTSIAYLFLRLSSLYPSLVFKDQSLLDWAAAYLDLGARELGARRQIHADVTPDHCGIANESLAQTTLNAIVRHDASLIRQLCHYSSAINSITEVGSDEWLYGRSGYLYFLRLARSHFRTDATTLSLIQNAIEATVSRIISQPQPWRWHGKAYLGAAHGAIGIICQVILCAPHAAPKLEKTLSRLLETQFPSGNFPSSLPVGSDVLVQFCHGGPGFVLALNSIKQLFPKLQVQIDQAVAAARKDIGERGLLTKDPCLCHGIAGNALALDDEVQFHSFLNWMSGEKLEALGWTSQAGRSDKFAGLYSGEAGRAWVWATADRNLTKTCIGFNDL